MKIKLPLHQYLKYVLDKSVILTCLDSNDQPSHPLLVYKIFNGAAVMPLLSTKTTSTFADYADQEFVPFLVQQLGDTCRVDLVLDRYLVNSIKGLTREHRGSSTRTKVSSQTLPPVFLPFMPSQAVIPHLHFLVEPKKLHGLPGIQRSTRHFSSCLRIVMLEWILHHLFFFDWRDSDWRD